MQQRFDLSKDDEFTMLSGIAHDQILTRYLYAPLFRRIDCCATPRQYRA